MEHIDTEEAVSLLRELRDYLASGVHLAIAPGSRMAQKIAAVFVNEDAAKREGRYGEIDAAPRRFTDVENG